MELLPLFLTALALGLLGGGHCIGMCGGLMANPEVHIVIAAAGQGKRMGADTNKLFLMLAHKPLIVWTVEKAVRFIQSLDAPKLGHIHLI